MRQTRTQIVFWTSIGLLALAALCGAYWYKARAVPSAKEQTVLPAKTYAVVLTENGFEPVSLKINLGDTVIFTTARSASFWPASDLHPTHELYPEFDPKQPVAQGSTWGFTFTKQGVWKYHDHLFPLYRGSIEVVAQKAAVKDSVVPSSCSGDVNSVDCITKKLADIAGRSGVTAAFDELARMYDADPEFAGVCHTYTHKIGEVAYEQFSRGESPGFTQKASYCGYGYYHGFMESLLHYSGDVEKARQFCRGATEQIQKGLGPQIEAACYHGIGHGAVAEGALTDAKSVTAFLEPGYKTCEIVGETFEHKKICGSGVFNSLALAWMKNEQGGAIDPGHPFANCEKVTQDYFRIACFHQMNTVVSRVTHADFPKALVLVGAVTKDDDARAAMDGVATQFGAGSETRNVSGDVVAKGCSGTQARLQHVCVKAYVGGLVEGGKPNEEEVRAISFCQNRYVAAALVSDCYQGLLAAVYAWMPKARADAICATLPVSEQAQCKKT